MKKNPKSFIFILKANGKQSLIPIMKGMNHLNEILSWIIMITVFIIYALAFLAVLCSILAFYMWLMQDRIIGFNQSHHQESINKPIPEMDEE